MKIYIIAIIPTLVICTNSGYSYAQSRNLPSKEQVVDKWYRQIRLLRSIDYKFSIKGDFSSGNIEIYNYHLRMNGDKYRLEVSFPPLSPLEQKKGFLTQSLSTYDGKSFYGLKVSNGSANLDKSDKPTMRTSLGAMPIHIMPFSFAIDDLAANYDPLHHLQNPRTWARVKQRIRKIEIGNHLNKPGFWLNMDGATTKQTVKVFVRIGDFYPIYSAVYENDKLTGEGDVETISAGNVPLIIPRRIVIRGYFHGKSEEFFYVIDEHPKVNQKSNDTGIYSISRSQTTLYREK